MLLHKTFRNTIEVKCTILFSRMTTQSHEVSTHELLFVETGPSGTEAMGGKEVSRIAVGNLDYNLGQFITAGDLCMLLFFKFSARKASSMNVPTSTF